MEKRINNRIDLLAVRVTGMEQTINKLDSRIGGLERTMTRKLAAIGAGFGMMSDQITD